MRNPRLRHRNLPKGATKWQHHDLDTGTRTQNPLSSPLHAPLRPGTWPGIHLQPSNETVQLRPCWTLPTCPACLHSVFLPGARNGALTNPGFLGQHNAHSPGQGPHKIPQCRGSQTCLHIGITREAVKSTFLGPRTTDLRWTQESGFVLHSPGDF